MLDRNYLFDNTFYFEEKEDILEVYGVKKGAKSIVFIKTNTSVHCLIKNEYIIVGLNEVDFSSLPLKQTQVLIAGKKYQVVLAYKTERLKVGESRKDEIKRVLIENNTKTGLRVDKNVTLLSEILNNDSKVLFAFSAMIPEIGNSTGVAAITDDGYLSWASKSIVGGTHQARHKFDKIIGVKRDILLAKKSVVIQTITGRISFNFQKKAIMDKVHNEVEKYIEFFNYSDIPEPNPVPKQQPSNKSISIPEEILKYKQLLDLGAISKEEYEQKKNELLNM